MILYKAFYTSSPGNMLTGEMFFGPDDYIVSILVVTHQVCKPATHPYTDKAATERVKTCQLPYANLSSHQPHLAK